jgi:hypothetical protein
MFKWLATLNKTLGRNTTKNASHQKEIFQELKNVKNTVALM